ncbi:DUF6246 family protein [Kerstersia gyiorum]|uniref:DUF6246 family protein n=1 Tax=Kerstersia gyiorum TaxID=206506 RepID=UPI0039EB450D
MILAEIGEIGVHAGGQVHVLCPSLYAMSKLGSPNEIVSLYAEVMSDQPTMGGALTVIFACCDEDLSEIFGAWIERDGKWAYERGQAEPAEVIVLARALLTDGITGALPPLPRKADEEPEYVQEFDTRAHVALAVAHLGIPERDAWQMTMTSLVAALRAKFPPQASDAPGSRAPSKEQMEATMEWFDRVTAARDKKTRN